MPWYQYSALASATPRPLVEARLWYGDHSVRLVALVDSGADCSLFDVRYADFLGLDRSSAQLVLSTGADGGAFSVLGWSHVGLEIEFAQTRIPFEGSFVDFPAGADAMNLLGRDDFFRQFVVQFWHAAELMNIDLSPDFPNPSLR